MPQIEPSYPVFDSSINLLFHAYPSQVGVVENAPNGFNLRIRIGILPWLEAQKLCLPLLVSKQPILSAA
jgi:hypothetical protein